MYEPGIVEKIAFLSKPEAYADGPSRVVLKETHMSCVFLTDRHAWKLKKPAHYDYLDFSTVDARKRNCELEFELNQRLAPDVYLGVVPLAMDAQGRMQLGGEGPIIDWLVKMRRLPEDRMLDAAIAAHMVSREDVRKIGVLLAGFYQRAPRIPLTPAQYASRLESETRECARELRRPEFALPAEPFASIFADQVRFLQENAAWIDDRARQGKIVDAHGDLRPEHICLAPETVIIDCLEFHPDFRVLDPVSELAFLALECERLGAPWIGEMVLGLYQRETGDFPSEALVAYYKRHHACIRAKIAVWHLKDAGVHDPQKWIHKAVSYLREAQSLHEFHQ